MIASIAKRSESGAIEISKYVFDYDDFAAGFQGKIVETEKLVGWGYARLETWDNGDEIVLVAVSN